MVVETHKPASKLTARPRHWFMRALLLACPIAMTLSWGSELARAQATTFVRVAEQGSVYLFGNKLDPPFSIEVFRDTIWVNGLQARPGPSAATKTPVTPAARSHYRVINELLVAVRALPENSNRPTQLSATVDAVLKADPAVREYQLNGENLTIHWSDSKIVDLVLLRPSGKNVPTPPGPERWTARQREVAVEWQEALDSGRAIVVSNHESYYIPKLALLVEDLEFLRSFAGAIPPRAQWKGRSLPHNELGDFTNPLPLDQLATRTK